MHATAAKPMGCIKVTVSLDKGYDRAARAVSVSTFIA